MNKSLFVSAGEVSGDLHGSQVISIIRKDRPDLNIFGLGGDKMSSVGVDLIEHCNVLAVMGLSEAFLRYRFFKKLFKRVISEISNKQPEAVLLIDYPGLNLRLAKYIKKMGIKVHYYISPKVWAWRYKRVQIIRKYVDQLYVIFPFEKNLFEKENISVHYVGNPLINQIIQSKSLESKLLPWESGSRVALLPGSRKQEVDKILPVMINSAQELSKTERVTFLIAAPNHKVSEYIKRHNITSNYKVIIGRTLEVMQQSDAAIIASGTATLEAALLGVPHLLIYKTSVATFLLAKLFLKVKYIGLVNILANKQVCTELVQGKATSLNIIKEVSILLNDKELRSNMLFHFTEIQKQLGGYDSSALVAAKILKSIS